MASTGKDASPPTSPPMAAASPPQRLRTQYGSSSDFAPCSGSFSSAATSPPIWQLLLLRLRPQYGSCFSSAATSPPMWQVLLLRGDFAPCSSCFSSAATSPPIWQLLLLRLRPHIADASPPRRLRPQYGSCFSSAATSPPMWSASPPRRRPKALGQYGRCFSSAAASPGALGIPIWQVLLLRADFTKEAVACVPLVMICGGEEAPAIQYCGDVAGIRAETTDTACVRAVGSPLHVFAATH